MNIKIALSTLLLTVLSLNNAYAGSNDTRKVLGSALGGVVGGVIGHQVGGQTGAMIGAIGGAALGHQVAEDHNDRRDQSRYDRDYGYNHYPQHSSRPQYNQRPHMNKDKHSYRQEYRGGKQQMYSRHSSR